MPEMLNLDLSDQRSFVFKSTVEPPFSEDPWDQTSMFVQLRFYEVFKHDITGKMFGTGKNCSFKWGVRLSTVFVGWGSTALNI